MILSGNSDENSEKVRQIVRRYGLPFFVFIFILVSLIFLYEKYKEKSKNELSEVSQFYFDISSDKNIFSEKDVLEAKIASLKEKNNSDPYLFYLKLDLSYYFLNKKMYKEALEALESIETNDVALNFIKFTRIAKCYLFLFDYEKSLAALRKLPLDIRNKYFYELEGDILFMNKQYSSSHLAYQKALSLYKEEDEEVNFLKHKIANVKDNL